MNKHPVSFLSGVLIGLTAMYFLDKQSGRSRRTMLRDKVAAKGRDAAHFARGQGRLVMDRARGMTSRRGAPRSDQQLHERIRSRLGHLVTHPRAIHVEVDRGTVRLTGGVLREEREILSREVEAMPGVTSLRDELQVHDSAHELMEAEARQEPMTGQDQALGTAVH